MHLDILKHNCPKDFECKFHSIFYFFLLLIIYSFVFIFKQFKSFILTLVDIVKPIAKNSMQTLKRNRVSFFLFITVNFFKTSLNESKTHSI